VFTGRTRVITIAIMATARVTFRAMATARMAFIVVVVAMEVCSYCKSVVSKSSCYIIDITICSTNNLDIGTF
jgi:hypothetical protein